MTQHSYETSPDLALVARLEAHSAKGWPSHQMVPLDDWEWRYTQAITSRRINSLNAIRPGAAQFETALERARLLAAERGVPCHVRLQPLAGDAPRAILTAKGVVGDGETLVQVAPLHASEPLSGIRIDPHVTEDWMSVYAGLHDYGAAEQATLREIFASVTLPQAFAVAYRDGLPAAVGRAAAGDALVGLYQIATLVSARRMGLAKAIVVGLMQWGLQEGAAQAYLQVEAGNAAARPLYASLGFETRYTYDYWKL